MRRSGYADGGNTFPTGGMVERIYPLEEFAAFFVGGAAPIAGKAAVEAVLVVDTAGTARILINGSEVSYHAAVRASERGITLGEVVSTVSSGAQFTYREAGKLMTGFYDAAKNIFVGLGERYSTIMRPSSGEKYIENLKNRP